MKIAFFSYPSAFQNPGGGEIQLLNTRKYLERIGVGVTLFDQWNHDLLDFDLLHVFGSVKDSIGLMETARHKGRAIALSTIFWSDLRRGLNEEVGRRKRLELVLRHAAKTLFPGFPSERRRMMLLSDILFPNSRGEAEQLVRYFGARREKIHVVPNGVDIRFRDASPEEFEARYGLRGFVLYAGRIEPRKNQLNFIRAMRDVDIPVVFLGDPVAAYADYYNRCRNAATANMRFLGHIPHESTLLASAYAACDVFALTSWFETPGLACLEAGLAGAKVVATVGGSTREYFGGLAGYARPDDPRDVREAVVRALAAEKSAALREHILAHYTWDRVAEATKAGYEKVLAAGRP